MWCCPSLQIDLPFFHRNCTRRQSVVAQSQAPVARQRVSACRLCKSLDWRFILLYRRPTRIITPIQLTLVSTTHNDSVVSRSIGPSSLFDLRVGSSTLRCYRRYHMGEAPCLILNARLTNMASCMAYGSGPGSGPVQATSML